MRVPPNGALEVSSLSAPRKAFLTGFRSSVMLSTCVAILAVDFPFFPRRFAKTESFGVSLVSSTTSGYSPMILYALTPAEIPLFVWDRSLFLGCSLLLFLG